MQRNDNEGYVALDLTNCTQKHIQAKTKCFGYTACPFLNLLLVTQILMALKGLENAGLAVSETIPTSLDQCIQSESNENEIRLAAISAFR